MGEQFFLCFFKYHEIFKSNSNRGVFSSQHLTAGSSKVSTIKKITLPQTLIFKGEYPGNRGFTKILSSFQRLSRLTKIELNIVSDFTIEVLQGLMHFPALKQFTLTLLAQNTYTAVQMHQSFVEQFQPLAKQLTHFSLNFREKNFTQDYVRLLLKIFEGVLFHDSRGIELKAITVFSFFEEPNLKLYLPYLKELHLNIWERNLVHNLECLVLFFSPQNNEVFE